jgi:NADPH:quinone reductase-like Zn-dependent oxidoreductase
METMKAVRLHNYGSADVLSYEDATRPIPNGNEVLIRVHATSVNPFDLAVRAGYLASVFHYTFPLIPGTDVSGVIESIGESVTNLKPGDEVYTRAGVYKDGAYAEYVSVLAEDVVAKPKSLDHIHAAALPHVTLAAWQALYESANLQKDQTVLIHGAAGGVGHVATQLAHLRGAKVIGTASTNLNFLHEIGVDEVIDYTNTSFEDVVHNVDVVLDTIGGDTQLRSWGVLKKGGMMVSLIQAPSEEIAAKYGVRQQMVMTSPPIGKTLAEVATLVDSGKIKPLVSAVMPLRDIRNGHRLVESRHTCGKIVLQVI